VARLGNFDVTLSRGGWFDITTADPLNGWFDKVAVGVEGSPPPPPPAPATAPLLGGGGGRPTLLERETLAQQAYLDLLDFEPSPQIELPGFEPAPELAPVEDLLNKFAPGERQQTGVPGVQINSPPAWCAPAPASPLYTAAPSAPTRDWFPFAMLFLGATAAVGVGVVLGRVAKDDEEKQKRHELDDMLAELRRKSLI